MSQAAASQQSGRAAVTQERATIRIHDIPTELLERLLGKYVQQVNENYQKTQGELKVTNFDENKEKEKPTVPKKRTLAEVSETFDIAQELNDRTVHLNNTFPLYGYPPKGDEMMEVSTRTDEPMADVLQAAVDQVMSASIRCKHGESDIDIRRSTLSQMTQWTALFFHLLTTRLQRLMEIQRRRLPNTDDLLLLLKEGYFDRKGIDEMHTLCEKYQSENSRRNRELQAIAENATSAYTGQDYGDFNVANDSVVMEEPWWIDQVVHRKKRKAYIPEWMPPLPPEHTFKSTPKYSQRVTNPVMLREKLVLEGRFGEKALDHIIVKEESVICSPLSEESISSNSSSSDNEEVKELEQIEGVEEEILTGKQIDQVQEGTQNDNDNNNDNAITEASSVLGAEPKRNIDQLNDPEANNEKVKVEDSTVEGATPSDKKVDLVELANKRMAVLEKKRKAEEQRYLSRVESDESRFGKNFGFYSNIKKFPDCINVELQEYRTKKLKEVVHSLRKQEKKNAKWVIEQEELRRRLDEEKSKYAEANEIQLGSGQDVADGNLFYADIDEEVDFDVEFSDMDEVYDGENPQKKKVLETGGKLVEPSMTDNDNNDEERVLSVRFQDEVETSARWDSKGEGEEEREGEDGGDNKGEREESDEGEGEEGEEGEEEKIEVEDPEAEDRAYMQESDHNDAGSIVMEGPGDDHSMVQE
ncbi:hypothetical protein PMKS-000921 [Pichia membranifaciens]|uniref:Transcription initiation factor TFIID subunit 8 n=1 Tax=Pichia membranifaciens TaxID=4926 RepID=A0A1Q2YDI5_9ASCO|nr:hypothetical protein PMKS-000921 [Pichia membranifaciens]